MRSDLGKLLVRFEHLRDRVLTPLDARAWRREWLASMETLGVLEAAGHAVEIIHEGCDHDCAVLNSGFQKHPNDADRIICIHRCLKGCGQVIFEPDDFEQWRFSLVGLAAAVARAIDAGGQVLEDIPDRLVVVGRIVAGHTWRDVFLARGLAWSDAASVLTTARRLKASGEPLVLALGELPGNEVWPDCHPAMALLSDIVSFDHTGLAVDLTGVIERPTKPHADAATRRWITVTEAARLLLDDVSGIELPQAKARVSKAASDGKFTTNAKHGQARRIDRPSFSVWRLEQREKDLTACE